MPSPALQSGYPFSFRSFTGDGSTTTYPVTFPYLAKAHVKVYLGDTILTSGYTWVTDGSLRFDAAPAVTVPILIRRETPVTAALVTYINAASLKASNLNISNLQLLYVIQENADLTLGAIPLLDDLNTALAQALQAAADAATARNAAQDAQTLAQIAAMAAAASQAATQAIVDALTTAYDVGCSVPFLPAAGEVFLDHAVIRDITLPAGAPGSWFGTNTAGSQDLLITLYKNNVAFATGLLPAFSTGVGMTAATATSFTLGDAITGKVTSANPSAPANFGVSLRFTLDLT